MQGVVNFSMKPRAEISELYDREKEVKQIQGVIGRGDWLSILGPRMVGKTSLARAILDSYERKGWNVLYVDLGEAKTAKDLFSMLYMQMPKGFIERAEDIASRFNIEISRVKIGYTPGSKTMKAIDYVLNNLPRKKIIIVLDEFQTVASGINELKGTFHKLMMEGKNLVFIFTGSAIGLMKTLQEPKGDEPLAGRPPAEVVLEPWSESLAKEYLRAGLKGCGVPFTDEEIDDVTARLGTLTGWLNYYGRGREDGRSHEASLRKAEADAKTVAKTELGKAIAGSAWRKKALKMMGIESHFNEMLTETNVSPTSLTKFLDRMERMYMIEKNGRNYSIADKMYRSAIREM